MPYASEKIIMTEVSQHIREHMNASNVFHDVNSTLYTMTSINTKARILLKVSNVFRSKDLVLFTVTSIHSIRKSTKNRNAETR